MTRTPTERAPVDRGPRVDEPEHLDAIRQALSVGPRDDSVGGKPRSPSLVRAEAISSRSTLTVCSSRLAIVSFSGWDQRHAFGLFAVPERGV